MLALLQPSDPFPPVERALKNPNGLLAAGADLSLERLLDAYRRGVFPWYSRGEPVLFALLAPNGRPVQTTRDLRSFWDRTYPEVRKELRGRYPKHPWPENPWTAKATHRTRKK